MIIRQADITKKPAIMLIHIDEVLKDKPPAKIILCRGFVAELVKCKSREERGDYYVRTG